MSSPEFVSTAPELARFGLPFLAIVINVISSKKGKKWILYPESAEEKIALEEQAALHKLEVSTAIPVLEGNLPNKLVISSWITTVQIAISLRQKGHPVQVEIIRPR